MPTPDSTTSQRPGKPFPDYPLFAHHNGQWAKKIRGRLCYFGLWADPGAALIRYQMEKDDLEAGRQPRPATADNALTVEQMVFTFLDAKKLCVQSGEMEARTWKDYEHYGDRMIRVFGAKTLVSSLGPTDFKQLRTDFQRTYKSLFSIKGAIRKTKVFFNWAGPGDYRQGLFERMPRFGDAFRVPSASSLRRAWREGGKRMFTADQLRATLAVSNVRLKSMILLGVNCAYGNMDCVKLHEQWLDLAQGWITMPRVKNGNQRRCPLWPETVEALRGTLARRKPPVDSGHRGRVFITKYGQSFRSRDLSRELTNAMRRAKVGDKRNFYDLRRTCVSIGRQLHDEAAMRTITGHQPPESEMLDHYDQLSVGDARLQRITDHIHGWLFTESDVSTPPEATTCGGPPDDPCEPAAP